MVLIPLQISASVLLATLLSQKKLKMRNTVRSLFFLPSILPTAAAMFMFKGFVDPDVGWLNRLILGPIGLAGLNQLSAPHWEQTLFTLVSLWAIGPGFLIMMASLQAIPTEIHEAAQIDGANLFQHFFGITVPLISPAIFFTLILNLTAIFAGAILLDRGDTFGGSYSTATTSYDSYLHYVLFDLQKLGYASSLGWTFFAFVMIVVLALFATAKYWVYFPDAER
jgi:multiple sugar transport system permease protein